MSVINSLKHYVKRCGASILLFFIKSWTVLLGNKIGLLLNSFLIENISPIFKIKTEAGPIQFYCPGTTPLWRARTLFTKEPDTIKWIDSFDPGAVFWDIGANVGIYSLYAAVKNKNFTLAFEPSAYNYFILNKNVEINKLDEKINALCLAFNDVTCLDYFYLNTTKVGEALHAFGTPIDGKGRHFTAKFKQGMIALTIDDFISRFNPPFPNYIKIDVDGFENKIIYGGRKALSNHKVKSLLIEINLERSDYNEELFEFLNKCGLTSVITPGIAKQRNINNYLFTRK